MTDLKTNDVRWDLNELYKRVDDPRIDADVRDLAERMKAFNAAYKGKLDRHLGEALESFAGMMMLKNKISIYLDLMNSLDTGNAATKAKIASVETALNQISGEYMTFFELEIAGLSDVAVETAMGDPYAKKHRPWINRVRILKPFQLSEPVEGALTKRAAFGPASWSVFFDEFEADLEFNVADSKKTLTEMLHALSESRDSSERARALQTINAGLGGIFAKYSAETLYNVIGLCAVEQKERGYKHPMQGRNLSNQIPDTVVDALHKSVTETAAPLAQRFYRLKSAHLGMKKLKWSDRNAPLPFAGETVVPFDEALRMVHEAYQSFSPTLAQLVFESYEKRRIDAPTGKGKRGGAFNASVVLPGGKSASWTFLNYLGSSRDVTTLAHELGHGVHGLLAGEAQGPLMCEPPIAYCETASVFGEMLTFGYLKQRLLARGEEKAYLALLMSKMDDMINTVVRQIGFSNFERRLHGMDERYARWEKPRKHSPAELGALWHTTLKELYGEEGDVFTYEHTENLWAYVSHFHSPFYVYGYAFGELLVHSLYAKQGSVGWDFEKLYLDLLRSGSTKDAVELLKPFGLDPTSKKFWSDGIALSLGAMLAEAEMLSEQMGIATS